MANRDRIAALRQLLTPPMRSNEICAALGISQSAFSRVARARRYALARAIPGLVLPMDILCWSDDRVLTHLSRRSDQAADDATRIEQPDLFGALIRSVIADESISADFKQIAAHHMDAITALDPCG